MTCLLLDTHFPSIVLSSAYFKHDFFTDIVDTPIHEDNKFLVRHSWSETFIAKVSYVMKIVATKLFLKMLPYYET